MYWQIDIEARRTLREKILIDSVYVRSPTNNYWLQHSSANLGGNINCSVLKLYWQTNGKTVTTV